MYDKIHYKKKKKESACSAGDAGLIPGLGRFLGEGYGNTLQYSCLENPMDRGSQWLQFIGSNRVRPDWATNTHTHTHTHTHRGLEDTLNLDTLNLIQSNSVKSKYLLWGNSISWAKHFDPSPSLLPVPHSGFTQDNETGHQGFWPWPEGHRRMTLG